LVGVKREDAVEIKIESKNPKSGMKREIIEYSTALRSFLIKAMGFLVRPLWNLLRARALKSLTSSSVDISRSASRSTPLKLNFLNVLFFGTPAAATSTSTSA